MMRLHHEEKFYLDIFDDFTGTVPRVVVEGEFFQEWDMLQT